MQDRDTRYEQSPGTVRKWSPLTERLGRVDVTAYYIGLDEARMRVTIRRFASALAEALSARA